MTDEDRPSGHLLSRREVVAFLGATGMAWLMIGSLNPRQAVAGEIGEMGSRLVIIYCPRSVRLNEGVNR